MTELLRHFAYAEDPATAPVDDAGMILRIPRGIRSKQKLLAVYADKLHFPRYFGWNWDAFYDCLCEHLAVSRRPITIVHEDLPFGETSEHRRTYLRILQDAASRAFAPGGNRLSAVFPAAQQAAIEANTTAGQ